MAFGIDDAVMIGLALVPQLGKLFGGGGQNSGNRTIYEKGNPLANPGDVSQWSPYFQAMFGQQAGGGGGGRSMSSTNSVTNMNQTTTPFVTPEYGPLAGLLRGRVQGRLSAPSALPPGYAEQGIIGINQGYKGGDLALQNRLTSMGLGGSEGPVASAFQNYDQNRIADLNSFRVGLPLMERQMQNEDLQIAQALIQALGLGSKMTGKSTTQSTTKGSSSGGGGSSLTPEQFAAMLQGQQNQAAQGQQGGGGGGFMDILGLLLGSGVLGGGKSGGGGLKMPGIDTILGGSVVQ